MELTFAIAKRQRWGGAQGLDISLKRPWRRASMHDLVKEATGVDFYALNDDLEAARYRATSLTRNRTLQQPYAEGPMVIIGWWVFRVCEVPLYHTISVNTLSVYGVFPEKCWASTSTPSITTSRRLDTTHLRIKFRPDIWLKYRLTLRTTC